MLGAIGGAKKRQMRRDKICYMVFFHNHHIKCIRAQAISNGAKAMEFGFSSWIFCALLVFTTDWHAI